MGNKKLRVACYGARGAYTYEAMEKQFETGKRKSFSVLCLKMW